MCVLPASQREWEPRDVNSESHTASEGRSSTLNFLCHLRLGLCPLPASVSPSVPIFGMIWKVLSCAMPRVPAPLGGGGPSSERGEDGLSICPSLDLLTSLENPQQASLPPPSSPAFLQRQNITSCTTDTGRASSGSHRHFCSWLICCPQYRCAVLQGSLQCGHGGLLALPRQGHSNESSSQARSYKSAIQEYCKICEKRTPVGTSILTVILPGKAVSAQFLPAVPTLHS